jgi:hypothetical protein
MASDHDKVGESIEIPYRYPCPTAQAIESSGRGAVRVSAGLRGRGASAPRNRGNDNAESVGEQATRLRLLLPLVECESLEECPGTALPD